MIENRQKISSIKIISNIKWMPKYSQQLVSWNEDQNQLISWFKCCNIEKRNGYKVRYIIWEYILNVWSLKNKIDNWLRSSNVTEQIVNFAKGHYEATKLALIVNAGITNDYKQQHSTVYSDFNTLTNSYKWQQTTINDYKRLLRSRNYYNLHIRLRLQRTRNNYKQRKVLH